MSDIQPPRRTSRHLASFALRPAISALACLCLSFPVAAQDTAGVGLLRGVVTEPDGAPAPDVAVCVTAIGQCAVTGPDGRFDLPARPGTYRLEIAAPSRPLVVSDEVQVRAGLDSEVEFVLPASGGLSDTITVTAAAVAAPEEVKTSGFLVTPEAISGSAGALQDVARFVQALPGVVIGSDDFRNDLIVRGGSPLENLYIVDNIEIPNINTFATFASAGGTVSILDAELIDNVTFLTGGFPAPYGNRTSSVLQIAQREGRRDRAAALATVGFAGAGVVAEGPIGSSRRGSWILSARRSFLDLFTDDTGIGGVPVLYTVNAKAVYDLSPRDRLWFVSVTGIDEIRLGLTDDSDLDSELSNLDINYDGWRAASGLNWQRVYGARGVGLLGATWSRASVSQQIKDLLRGGLPAAGTPVEDLIAAGAVVFREESAETEAGLKYDLTLALPLVEKLQVGGAVKRLDIAYDAASPFGTDSPFFTTPDANPFALRESFTTSQAGAYAQLTRRVAPRLDLTGGARVDHYAFTSVTRVSPRLGADYAVAPRVSLRASYGRYFQQPFLLFLTAYPENRSLEPFRSDHYVGGMQVQVDSATRLTVEAYRKTYRDYPVSSQVGALSLAGVGDTFAVRDVLFPMTSAGRGDAVGLELHAERRATSGRWQGEANLTVSRSRYSGIDGVMRPGSFDYPIAANVQGAYRVSDAWRLSARLAYLAGRPYTPFDEDRSTSQRRAVYDLAQVNARRAPDYFRLDLRVDRTFRATGRPIVVFAGAQNVTNRRNVARYSWDRRANRPRIAEQLGVFPILGLEWRF
jgi:outer membrane receptor protein involved in Fe transport